MKYFVCYRDEFGNTEYIIEEYEGTNPGTYFANKLYYGGDPEGCPENYIPDLEYPTEAFIVLFNCMEKLNFDSIDKKHKEWHRKEMERRIEVEELKELERLKRKYMGRK